MEIRYKSDANHNYMIINRDSNFRINQEKMVIRNNIEGLLKMNLHFVNETAMYYYEIQSRQSLSRMFEGRSMSYEELGSFLYGMVRAFRELEAYLLPTDGILLDPEAIYVDMDSCTPEFAFFPSPPSSKESVQEGFLKLSEFLTEHIDSNDNRAVGLAYDYYMSVCDGVFSPEGILKTMTPVSSKNTESRNDRPEDMASPVLEPKEEGGFDYWETEEDMSELDYFLKDDEKKQEGKGTLKVALISFGFIIAAAVIYLVLVLNPAVFPFAELNEKEYIVSGCIIALLFGGALTGVIFIYNRQRVRDNETAEAEKKKKLEKRDDDPINEREVREYRKEVNNTLAEDTEDDRTTLLSCKRYSACALLSGEEFGKNICFTIDRDPFILGKKKDKADGVINDKAISRMHASITEKNGRYFLSDMNSTNGTFLNGRRLEPNETVGLEDGDTLALAGTYMRFRFSGA